MQITLNSPAVTMTSREIAELIEKQHSNIKISAERLSSAGVIGTLAAQEFTHNGNTYTHSSPRAHNSGTAFPEGSGPWGFFLIAK